MKVLLVTHFWSTNSHHSISSGYERLAKYLALDPDLSVDVLTWGTYDNLIKEDNLNVYIKKTPTTTYFFERRLALSYHAAKIAKNYDLIHALYSDVGLLPTFTKYPVVVTEHNVLELDRSLWMWYKTFLIQRLTLNRAKSVITVSRNLRKAIKENYSVKKSIFIPHGIDIHIFEPQKQNYKKIKEQLLDNKFKYLCLSCGIVGVNSKTFIKVAKELSDILFIIVGRENNSTKFCENIFSPGTITEEELIMYQQIADFCFKPLSFATANNAILEAMAMGKVFITNKIDGVTDYLDDSCAYLVNDDADFPKVIKTALNNPKDLKIKGKKAREKAVKEFAWEVIAKKVKEHYKKVLKIK